MGADDIAMGKIGQATHHRPPLQWIQGSPADRLGLRPIRGGMGGENNVMRTGGRFAHGPQMPGKWKNLEKTEL
jgi:hypothetical protein